MEGDILNVDSMVPLPFSMMPKSMLVSRIPAGDSRANQATIMAVKPTPPATESVSCMSAPLTCITPARPQMAAERNMVRKTIFFTGMPA